MAHLFQKDVCGSELAVRLSEHANQLYEDSSVQFFARETPSASQKYLPHLQVCFHNYNKIITMWNTHRKWQFSPHCHLRSPASTFQSSEAVFGQFCTADVHSALTAIFQLFAYCNSLLYGISDGLLRRLQSVQNVAARLVTCAHRCDHITPVLRQLHCLPVRQRVAFKVAGLVHQLLIQSNSVAGRGRGQAGKGGAPPVPGG